MAAASPTRLSSSAACVALPPGHLAGAAHQLRHAADVETFASTLQRVGFVDRLPSSIALESRKAENPRVAELPLLGFRYFSAAVLSNPRAALSRQLTATDHWHGLLESSQLLLEARSLSVRTRHGYQVRL
jgi:hypothetical protein